MVRSSRAEIQTQEGNAGSRVHTVKKKIILKNKFKRISLNFLNEVSFEPKIIHPG